MLLPLWSHCAAVSSLLLFFFLGFFGQFPFRSILWIFLLLETVDLTVHVQGGVNLNSLIFSYLSSNVKSFQCQAGTAKDLTKSRSFSKFIMWKVKSPSFSTSFSAVSSSSAFASSFKLIISDGSTARWSNWTASMEDISWIPFKNSFNL